MLRLRSNCQGSFQRLDAFVLASIIAWTTVSLQTAEVSPQIGNRSRARECHGLSHKKYNTGAVHVNPKRKRGIAFEGGAAHSPSLTLRVSMLHFFPNRPYYWMLAPPCRKLEELSQFQMPRSCTVVPYALCYNATHPTPPNTLGSSEGGLRSVLRNVGRIIWASRPVAMVATPPKTVRPRSGEGSHVRLTLRLSKEQILTLSFTLS